MKMFNFHFHTDMSKNITVLRNAGFDGREIKKLCELRRRYKMAEEDQAELPREHLMFLRWLVEHGRFNEDFS